MADRITITPEELRTASSNFESKAGELEELLNYLKTQVENLEQTWDGAAQDQFFIMYNELNNNLKQMPEVLKSISANLSNVAQTMEETDNALASQLKG